jgi:hypothetical protein
MLDFAGICVPTGEAFARRLVRRLKAFSTPTWNRRERMQSASVSLWPSLRQLLNLGLYIVDRGEELTCSTCEERMPFRVK